MTISTITPLPTAPARTDPPATFVTRADSFLAALVVMQGELNTSIGQMNTDIPLAIAASETAVAAAASAVAAAGATEWVSGTTYAEGDAVWSPVTYQTYRRKTDGAGTTDPSADTTNWEKISGVLPTQTGNADKFLTTDGTTASWANLPASAGSADFVATGAITAGQTVGLRSDGTIEVISGATGAESFGAEVLTGGSNNPIAIYDSVNNKVIAIFNNGANAGSVQVGTVSGQTITFASSVQFATNYNGYPQSDAVYDPVNERVAIFYRSSVNGSGTAIVGQVIGTTMTFGSEVVFDANSSTLMRAKYDAASGNILVVYDTNGSLGSILATISGTSISFGTLQIISYSNPDGVRIARDNVNNKYYVAANGGTTISLFVVSISGSTITAGAANSTSQYAESNYFDIAYDENAERLVYLYRDVSSNSFYIAIGTISGDTITLTSGSLLDASNTAAASNSHDLIYNPSAKKTYAAIRVTGDANYIYELTINGTAFTSSIKQNLPASTAYINSVFDPDTNQIIYYYQDAGTADLQARTYSPFFLTTNANSYIGIATANISNGATGTINILGGTNASQSGLTVGADYWLNLDGTLSATKTNYAKIGYATAADTIVLSANSNESTAINSGGLYLTAANDFSAGDIVFYNNGVASSLSINPVSTLSTTSNTSTTISSGRATPFIFIASPSGGLFVMRNSSNYLVATPMLLENGSWTAGTTSNLYTGTLNSNEASMDGVYNPVSGAFWIIFSDSSYYGRRVGVTVSSTGLTISGTNQQSVTASNQGNGPNRMAIDRNTGRMLASFYDPSTNQSRPVAWTNETGTTISHDDRNNTYAGWYTQSGVDIEYAPEYDKFVVLMYNANSYQYYAVVSYDGVSDPSYPSQTIITAMPNNWADDYATMTWCSAHNCFLWLQYSAGSLSPGRSIVRVFPFNGTTVTYDTSFDLYTLSGNSNVYSTYATYKYKTIHAPFDSNLVSINNSNYVTLWTYDGSTMSEVTRTGQASEGYVDYSYDTLSLHWLYTSSTTVGLRTYPLATTNSYAFIGFSSADYSSGDICQIDTASSINNNQTGLTAGSDYYISGNGSLTTTDTGTSAGKALSETEIFVKV